MKVFLPPITRDEFLREAVPWYREAIKAGTIKGATVRVIATRMICGAVDQSARYSLDVIPKLPLSNCPAPKFCRCSYEIVADLV